MFIYLYDLKYEMLRQWYVGVEEHKKYSNNHLAILKIHAEEHNSKKKH